MVGMSLPLPRYSRHAIRPAPAAYRLGTLPLHTCPAIFALHAPLAGLDRLAMHGTQSHPVTRGWGLRGRLLP